MGKLMQEMDNEANQLQSLSERIANDTAVADHDGGETSEEVDRRSVYVGQVDYGATPEELHEHFKNCGPINRVTILVDKFSGCAKGFAYVEFSESLGSDNA